MNDNLIGFFDLLLKIDRRQNPQNYIIKENKAMNDEKDTEDLPEDEEIVQLMKDNDIDKDTAEKAQELIDEGLDENDAIEIAEEI